MAIAHPGPAMGVSERIPMVRCRLDNSDWTEEGLRYVPLAEFELWRNLMQTRHAREVSVEAISIWISEEPEVWNSGFSPEELEPVLRVKVELPGPHGVPRTVVRYFPAETYPVAQEKLLSHMEGAQRARVVATPGYFVPAEDPTENRQPLRLVV
jgi:hypothetical protein